MEVTSLQLDHDDVAVQACVVEKQVEEELFVSNLQAILVADEREADAELQQEVPHVSYEAGFDLALVGVLCNV